ncbi:hypothetical protein N7512_002996 [Penicillium capsulatum]|nr:hypothetical protein N7512_002996 [Penicillium capsulatum]
MTKFRPCIDLHSGQVKQIVGGTLSSVAGDLKTNYVSKLPASHYAGLYQKHNLRGGHVVKLGPGNDEAALESVQTWPNGLQVAGGITDKNAQYWIDQGAEKSAISLWYCLVLVGSCGLLCSSIKDDANSLRRNAGQQVIITSFLFPSGKFSLERLQSVLAALGGDKSKLVLDLSCRRKDNTWFVAMDRWQTITEMEITQESIALLEPYCAEFLIHAADVEGLQQGVDEELVSKLAEWCTIPVTYAGGARSLQDLEKVHVSSKGKVDLTIGSALDIFVAPARLIPTDKMKPVVSALNAWSWLAASPTRHCLRKAMNSDLFSLPSVVISLFAIVILSVLGSLFHSNNHAYTGTEGEPEDGPAVAASIYVAVIVYAAAST